MAKYRLFCIRNILTPNVSSLVGSLPDIIELLKFADRNISIRQKASGELKKSNFTFFNSFNLGWSHYLVLVRTENINERNFYEIEAHKSNWSEPQLKRQLHSSLYERLALSRDKEQVLKLAKTGQIIEKSTDILKNPLVLEFLSLEESHAYLESTLEKQLFQSYNNFSSSLGKAFCLKPVRSDLHLTKNIFL